MSVINNNLLLTAAAGATGYQVSRSLRFNSADSAYLSKSFGSAGNRKTWTWSAWVKRSALGGEDKVFTAGSGSTITYLSFGDNVTDGLTFARYTGTHTFRLSTTQVFRDPSAWYHILLAVDTSQATDTNRVKLYVNGIQVTVFTTASYPGQNTEYEINNANDHRIGDGTGNYANAGQFDGYLADIWFLDGIAATPSDFAETDATTGQWVPKAYTGSKGTNGFHLEFADNSAATAAALGKDTSGNSPANNWTPNNFQVAAGTNYTSTGTLSSGAVNTGLFKQPLDGGSFSYSPGDGTATITFSPSIPVTGTVRIRGAFGASSGQVGGATDLFKVNGTDVTQNFKNANAFLTILWVDVTSAAGSAITSLSCRTQSGISGAFISGVEVNGVRLVDGSASQIDSLVDTPSSYGTDDSLGGSVRGNYCTLNPLANGLNLTNGNLDFDIGTRVNWKTTTGTYYLSSGKWYWEVTTATQNTSGANIAYGIRTISSTSSFTNELGYNDSNYAYFASGGKRVGNTASIASYGASYTTGDVIGIALDMDAGTLTMYKNGSSQGTLTTGLTGSWTPAFGIYTGGTEVGTSSFNVNFGQRSWVYQAPAGFKALCDTNLTAPVIAKPNTVMDVKLYTGNGSSQTISGLNFSPDLVWVKSRSNAEPHILFDTVRGVPYGLSTSESGGTVAEFSEALASFNSDGWSYTSASSAALKSSGYTYVAWTWDAGSSTVTNTQGSITCQLRANATSGFSVATFTGATTGTIGHGLGVAPSMIIMKARTSNPGANDWFVYHKDVGNTKALVLNSTAAPNTYTYWNNTSPTSTVFSIGSGLGTPDWVAYCFAPVAGYSAMGSYTGNGSTDGPFVFCNFRPRWILIKVTSQAGDQWVIHDSVRDTYNVANKYLLANSSGAEATSNGLDILSNGFKVRDTSGSYNTNGATYVYFAVAENPFQYARAR